MKSDIRGLTENLYRTNKFNENLTRITGNLSYDNISPNCS